MIISADHAAALHGQAGIAMGVEATAKPFGRGGKRGRDGALLDGELT